MVAGAAAEGFTGGAFTVISIGEYELNGLGKMFELCLPNFPELCKDLSHTNVHGGIFTARQ